MRDELVTKGAGSTITRVLLGIMALVVIGGVGYGVYAWQHREVDRLNQQVSRLTSELNTATKKQSAQTSQTPGMMHDTPMTRSADNYTSEKGVSVKIYTPASGSTLTSPIVVMGEVPGNWSFEASFPVKLLDGKGNAVAQASAHLIGDWMTDKPVPFTVTLTFTKAASGSGTLVLQKDNPSGIAAHDDTVSLPVTFP